MDDSTVKNISDLRGWLNSVFESVGGKEWRSRGLNSTSRKLHTIIQSIHPWTLKHSKSRRELISTILDAYCLASLCSKNHNRYEYPSMDDVSKIGSSRDRRSKIRGEYTKFREWQHENRFRANFHSRTGKVLVDLRGDRQFKNKRSCDFHYKSVEGTDWLVECTRIFPENHKKVTVDAVLQKMATKVAEKQEQIESSAAVLGLKSYRSNTIIDITDYVNDSWSFTTKTDRKVLIEGWKADEVQKLLEKLKYLVTDREITLTWDSLLTIEDMPIALTQNNISTSSDIYSPEWTLILTDQEGGSGFDWNISISSVAECFAKINADYELHLHGSEHVTVTRVT